MKRLMGLLLTATLLTGLLAGCAGTPAGNSNTNTPESTPAATATSTPESTPTATSTPEASDDAEEAAWPRTYVDATGAEVVIEKQPERVALGHFGIIESFYALGIVPVAAFNNGVIEESPVLGALLDVDIIELGFPMNLESLLEAEPDLIIVYGDANAEIRESLEKISTVVQPNYPDGYNANNIEKLREHAKIVGKEEEAEKLIAEIEAKLTEGREKLASVEDTVMLIGLSEKAVSIYGPLAPTPFYGEDGLGLNAPEGLPNIWWEQSSLEALTVLNPDHIFIRATQEQYDKEIASMSDSSVWNSLTAVKNGQVYRLEEALFSSGPLGVTLFVDYAVEKLAK